MSPTKVLTTLVAPITTAFMRADEEPLRDSNMTGA
jgi:hypothetical protein